MDFLDEIIVEEAILGGGFGRRRGYGGQGVLGTILEVEAIEDLVEGDIGGFVEDEFLASVF